MDNRAREMDWKRARRVHLKCTRVGIPFEAMLNDRLSATMKHRTRLYEDRTSAANASDSEG